MAWPGPDEPDSTSLAPSRLPLAAPRALSHPASEVLETTAPRPFGTRFAMLPVHIKHKRPPTHGVRRRATKYIDDGQERPDSVDEPYED